MIPCYLNNPDSVVYSSVIQAWMTNYQPEDADTLASFVTSITDKDLLHRIGMDLFPPVLPESVLTYLYENTPCSECRNRLFQYIMLRYHDMTNLPAPVAAIREEAKWDCDYGTRMIARGKSIRKAKSE